jgi:TolB-like protein
MATIHRFGPFRLDAEANILFRGAEPIALGQRAVALLRVLVEQPGVPVSKRALIGAAWRGVAVEESNLTVQIAALRRVLGEDEGGASWIETLPRRGYRFVGPPVTADQITRAGAPLRGVGSLVAVPEKPSIAVLPFENMSSDPDQEHFADGMTEDIITGLSKLQWVAVVARNSTFVYKGGPVSIKQVGADLGVRYVLEGSVRKAGDRMRVTGQLIEAATGEHLWAERYDAGTEDPFAIQDEITQRLVGAIDTALRTSEGGRTAHRANGREGAPATAGAKTTGTPRLSIVVLPFVNLSPDNEQDGFVDALTDILITELSRIPRVFVMARNIAFSLKGKQVDVRRIVADLGVRYVLEGSVQISAERIRINAQLIDAETGGHVWAERFDRPRADSFVIQDEITSRLARAISVELVAAESARAERDRQNDMDSVDLTLRGWAIYNKLTSIAGAREARRVFEAAARLDEKNVDALLGIADTHLWEVTTFASDAPAEQLRLAEAAISQAMVLDPDNIRVHAHRGRLHAATKAPDLALREFEHIISIDPTIAFAHAWVGLLKVYLGHAEETEAHVAEAIRLGPRDPLLGFWYHYLGIADFHLDRLDHATGRLRKAVAISPGIGIPYFYLAAALALTGHMAAAAQACANGRRLMPGFTIGKFRRETMSDNPVFLAQRERVYDGLRKAKVPE